MATRQRTRNPRKSANTPVVSGNQLSETTAPSNERVDDSAVLRAAFDTTPFEEGEAQSSAGADAPKATFVGEQLIYKDRYERIAEAAYHRAEQRGFEPGYELEDWLAAEREVDAMLSSDGKQDTR